MTKKRAPNSRRRRSKAIKKRSFLSRFGGILLKLTLVLMVVGGIGLIYLDAQVRDKFEGKRWALPAKVYARPLELYVGQKLSVSDLKRELQGLGYASVKKSTRPGTMEVARTRVRVFTRGFFFPDGEEPQRHMLISFKGNSISSIRSASGQPVSLARLEPVLIGGIYTKENEDRDLIRLDQAPDSLRQALIAVEDRDFYDHAGVSVRGIARAMWVNVRSGRFAQGGSTLTQQLVKNFYLTSDRTLARKLLEIPMALLLDAHYEKDEILEAYLNEVYLGQSGARAVHGFGLASQYYFARPIHELQLHQVALLVGLVKGPSFYDPRRNPERSKKRRNLVLRLLADGGDITEAEMLKAQKLPLGVVKQQSLLKGAYPAYLDLVKRQLREEYPEEALSSEGLRVFTSLDPTVQARAETALVKTVTRLQKRFGQRADKLQGGMVVTDPQTAEVLAVVGGKNTRYQGFNRALDARRPIGSLVKPAVFLAALEEGYTLASLLDDAPIRVEMEDGQIWEPRNFDKKSHGQVALHRALSNSYNLSTAQLGMSIGLDNVAEMLKRLGMERDPKRYPSLLLGAESMTPFEVATLYQTIAANGFRMPMRAIRLVTTAEGEELSRYPLEVEQEVSTAQMHLIQYALQEVVREGTARYVYSQLPVSLNVAGKTGTSNGQRDSWFAGFAGNRLAVVWLGRDDNSKLPFTGSGGALRAWTEYIRREQPEPFLAAYPEGVEYHWVDEKSGYLSDELCEGAQQVPFIAGTEPKDEVDCGQRDPVQRSFRWFQQWFRQE